MRKYLIWKKITAGFRISDMEGETENDKAAKKALSETIMYKKMRENYDFSHPWTRIFGEVSDITFSEAERERDFSYLADNYWTTGTYTIKTNKLLSVLDKIEERYVLMKKYGISFSQVKYLIGDIIEVLRTDFKDLEEKSLLQMKEVLK